MKAFGYRCKSVSRDYQQFGSWTREHAAEILSIRRGEKGRVEMWMGAGEAVRELARIATNEPKRSPSSCWAISILESILQGTRLNSLLMRTTRMLLIICSLIVASQVSWFYESNLKYKEQQVNNWNNNKHRVFSLSVEFFYKICSLLFRKL